MLGAISYGQLSSIFEKENWQHGTRLTQGWFHRSIFNGNCFKGRKVLDPCIEFSIFLLLGDRLVLYVKISLSVRWQRPSWVFMSLDLQSGNCNQLDDLNVVGLRLSGSSF